MKDREAIYSAPSIPPVAALIGGRGVKPEHPEKRPKSGNAENRPDDRIVIKTLFFRREGCFFSSGVRAFEEYSLAASFKITCSGTGPMCNGA
jgi:hypothetical protein